MASNVTKSDKTSSRHSEDFEKDLLGSNRSTFWVILTVIWFPFKVVLYPFIWVGRDFRRMLKFLTNRSAGPMNYEEISLVESVPVFLKPGFLFN